MAKPDKKESRFDAKYSDGTVAEQLTDGLLTTLTGGLIPREVTCKLTDKETGETHDGYGGSKHTSHENARGKFEK